MLSALVAAPASQASQLARLFVAACQIAFSGPHKASTAPVIHLFPSRSHICFSSLLGGRPAGGASKTVAIVGKGLTFDSGGYNLKAGPGSMIEMMKTDMVCHLY